MTAMTALGESIRQLRDLVEREPTKAQVIQAEKALIQIADSDEFDDAYDLKKFSKFHPLGNEARANKEWFRAAVADAMRALNYMGLQDTKKAVRIIEQFLEDHPEEQSADQFKTVLQLLRGKSPKEE